MMAHPPALTPASEAELVDRALDTWWPPADNTNWRDDGPERVQGHRDGMAAILALVRQHDATAAQARTEGASDARTVEALDRIVAIFRKRHERLCGGRGPKSATSFDSIVADALTALRADLAEARAAIELYDKALNEAEAILGGEYATDFAVLCEWVIAAREARAALTAYLAPPLMRPDSTAPKETANGND